MKDWWKRIAGRIDDLSLRERALLFVSLLVCGLVLGDQFWLAPAQQKQQLKMVKVKQQDAELLLLRTQLLASKTEAPAANAAQAVRLDMAALQNRMEAVNREIEQLSRLGGQSDPLPKVLLHILRRHEGLTLERTATLAPEATASTQVGAAAPSVPLLRQGMEFTVTGSYGELMRYVQTLELELPALRWGAMKLSSGKPMPSLTLQVFWLGAAP